MSTPLRLLCVLAHPDDETFAAGGILARYAGEGVGTYLLTATRGEQGWQGSAGANPGPASLGRIREDELRAAARILGLRGVRLLGYPDGTLAEADPVELSGHIAGYIRQVQPQVVITFGPDGLTGHPDHIAIGQLTLAALLRAADPDDPCAPGWSPHQISKLYYLADSRERLAAFEAIFGDTAMTVDGMRREVPGWPPWAITTRVNTAAAWRQVWTAIGCHRSQVPTYDQLCDMPEEQRREIWSEQELYRVFSLVRGPAAEDDLLEGLRAGEEGVASIRP